MGIAFGASGLIAMGAGVISTVLSVPGYKFLYWNYDSPMAQKLGGNLFSHEMKKWKQVISDFFKVIYKILRIITAPIWITRSLLSKYSKYKSRSTAVV
jgi:hypothetical protein